MLSLVSTWMGDRLGTLGAVGIKILFILTIFSFRKDLDFLIMPIAVNTRHVQELT